MSILIGQKKYVNEPECIASYNEESLKLIAEATFFSVKFGLEDRFKNISYSEFAQFKPIQERMADTKEGSLIDNICWELKNPKWSHQASYALQQAAYVIYIKHNSYAKTMQEKKEHEESKENRLKRKM